MMNQVEKARDFAAMHQRGNPLKLYNIWDTGSAQSLVQAGAKALATGSWSVAAAQGYDDGQKIPLDWVFRNATRIATGVSVPVSLDFEGGYAGDPETLALYMTSLLETGVIGMNFEDQVVGGEGLYAVENQVARIAALRSVAEKAGIPFFINARTDLFLKKKNRDQHASLLAQAQKRGEAYAAAGASGFFVPGLMDPQLIETLCRQISLPVNVMHMGEGPLPHDFGSLGVARISLGPGPYRRAMIEMVKHFKEVFSA